MNSYEEYNKALERFFVKHQRQRVIVAKGQAVPLPTNMSGYLQKGRLEISLDGQAKLWYVSAKRLIPENLMLLFVNQITAVEDTEILYVDQELFEKFAFESAERLEIVAQQLYQSYNNCLGEVLKKDKDNNGVRVYRFIYQMALNYGEPWETGKLLPLPEVKDIAEITGIEEENIRSYVQRLKKMDLLRVRDERIEITDLEALAALIEEAKAL